MFKLGHVTDPHFRGYEGLQFGDLFNKRAVGLANLVINRRRKHRMELLEAMRADVAGRGLDHLAVTGDLSNVSLPGEWQAALRWLGGSGLSPEAVTVIPGNHDTYLPAVVESGVFERLFAAHQTAENKGAAAYPFVRTRGDVALVALNSCVPTGDLHAWGRLGEAQLSAVEAALSSADLRGRLRVVLIHHPPLMLRPPENRNLRDREDLCAVLGRVGADLVLHGHDHRETLELISGPGGARIPVIGGGSASYSGKPHARARYNVFEIDGRAITWVVYAHDEATGGFREARRQLIS